MLSNALCVHECKIVCTKYNSNPIVNPRVMARTKLETLFILASLRIGILTLLSYLRLSNFQTEDPIGPTNRPNPWKSILQGLRILRDFRLKSKVL